MESIATETVNQVTELSVEDLDTVAGGCYSKPPCYEPPKKEPCYDKYDYGCYPYKGHGHHGHHQHHGHSC
jgi:hypothetical protein